MFKAAPLDQPYGRIDDRLRGEVVLGAVLQAENITGQVEGADLAAAVGEEFMATNRSVNDLENAFFSTAFVPQYEVDATSPIRRAMRSPLIAECRIWVTRRRR